MVASATSNEPAPALAAPDLAGLRQSALTDGGAVAYVVNTNTGQSAQISLTPRRPGGQVDYGPDRDAVLNENLSQVKQALGAATAGEPAESGSMSPRVGMAEFATGYDGGRVLTAYAIAPKTRWTVFVQQPLTEALARSGIPFRKHSHTPLGEEPAVRAWP